MLDARAHFGRGYFLASRLKEIHRGAIFERGRVSHVDNDFTTRKRLLQTFASNCVNASVRGGGNCLMVIFLQLLYDLRPDEAGSFNVRNSVFLHHRSSKPTIEMGHQHRKEYMSASPRLK